MPVLTLSAARAAMQEKQVAIVRKTNNTELYRINGERAYPGTEEPDTLNTVYINNETPIRVTLNDMLRREWLMRLILAVDSANSLVGREKWGMSCLSNVDPYLLLKDWKRLEKRRNGKWNKFYGVR